MVDVNKPLENPELVEAMEALLQNDTKENEARLYSCLMEANFLMVLWEPLVLEPADEEGKIEIKKDATIAFPMLADGDNRPMHFGFTDWGALYKWREQPDLQTLIVPFSDLPALILKDNYDSLGFLINPCSHNFLLPRELVAHLNQKPNSYIIPKETKVLLGEPKVYPAELMEAVRAKLKTMREVKRVWLLQMAQDDELGYLIIVEHKGDMDEISYAIGSTAVRYLADDMSLNIVDAAKDFGREAVQDKKPFYRRGLFG